LSHEVTYEVDHEKRYDGPMRTFKLSFLSGLAAFLVAAPLWAASVVKPDNAWLQYTGRIDFARAGGPELSWPGTSIEGKFTGTSLALKLDDQYGKNFFNVFIDGDLERPVIVQAEQGSRTYPITSKLAPGEHRFLLTKRTEGEEGATVFQGLELADDGKLLPPPPRKTRHIEFFGDSITSGMGNESPDDGPDHLTKDKNNFMSYASITARNLDAEPHFVSQSGIGVMISWFPFTMPDFYDQMSAVGNNDSKWDFSSWTPDVVVINLTQNDKWLIDREHRLKPEPDDAQRVQAYKQFVQKIRALYPKAYIVCALGSMDAIEPGSKWPGYVRKAVEQMDDQRIDTLVFDFTGYTHHPRVKHHQANAAKLTAFIRQKMGW
jgi:lysophospholipase L1-like esterase